MSANQDGQGPGDEPDMTAFEDQLAEIPSAEGASDQEGSGESAAELESVREDLARTRADLYNLNQEYSGYVRRSKADAAAQRSAGQEQVIEALLSVLDDIEGARIAGELEDGPFAAISAKLEDTLNSRFGLERFGAEGDDFDPQLHEALMAQTNPTVDHPVVKQVLQVGYRTKDRVLRPTKVMVDNPE